MKNCKSCLSTGLLILRLLVWWIFLYHGITKLGGGEGMVQFVGGAFHSLGLTFLSMSTRLLLLAIGEIVAWALFIFGIFTRVAAVFVVIVMLGAMNAKGRSGAAFVEKDFILLVLAIVVACTWTGKYALSSCLPRCCGSSCDTENK